MTLWLTPVLIIVLLMLFAVSYRYLRRRYPEDNHSLVDTIDAMLPQTQCAQCNYPGCRPYAEAIAGDRAALNLCPPGGTALHQQLIELMGHEQAGAAAPEPADNVIAVIDEPQCIGCTLCLPPCPVDAIVGASGKMHTVVPEDCTGCALCLPACPVDCITLVAVSAPIQQRRRKRRAQRDPHKLTNPHTAPRGCINCGHCNPVCPVNLPVQELIRTVQINQSERAVEFGLMDCVECGLCDQVCPSNIALAQIFSDTKAEQHKRLDDSETRGRFKARFEAHVARLTAAEHEAARRREARLQRHRDANRWQ